MADSMESFDVTIPQQYLDAIAAHEAKIDAQMEVWKTYISELSGSDTLRRLAKQMSMLSQPLEREIESQQILLGRKAPALLDSRSLLRSGGQK